MRVLLLLPLALAFASAAADSTCSAASLYASQRRRKSKARRRYNRETSDKARRESEQRRVYKEEMTLRYRKPETDYRARAYACGGSMEEEDRSVHLYVQDMYYNNTLDALTKISESDGEILAAAEVYGTSVSSSEGGCPEFEYGEVPTWHFLEFMSHPAVGLRPHESFVDVGSGRVGTCCWLPSFESSSRCWY